MFVEHRRGVHSGVIRAGWRAVIVEKMSEREVARQFGLARETVRKMMRYSAPPGYRRQQPVRRPKLGAWIGTIDQILEADKAEGKKQRHTAKRIFERLRVKLPRFFSQANIRNQSLEKLICRKWWRSGNWNTT